MSAILYYGVRLVVQYLTESIRRSWMIGKEMTGCAHSFCGCSVMSRPSSECAAQAPVASSMSAGGFHTQGRVIVRVIVVH